MPYHSDEKNSPMGVDKKLTQKQMEKLLEHSKQHKGGMRSKHMRDMIKHMKKGDTFSTAHNKAMGKKGQVQAKHQQGEVVLDGKKITFKEGALRNQLKMPEDRKFTKSELNKLKNIENGKEFNFLGNKFKMTPLLKKRITFGLTLMGNK
jgi:hypothetical protein